METTAIGKVSKECLSSFDCGNDELNSFLLKYAAQNDRKGIGRTLVVIEENRAIGYYTLAAAQLCFEELPLKIKKGLPGYPIPCVRLARLAVDRSFQGKGYGAALLKDALLRTISISELAGICFVIVDVKKGAEKFYERYGFIPLEGRRVYLMSLKTLRKAVSE